MWTRAEIKERAKVVLKKGYGKAFLVSIIILLVGASGASGSNSSSFRNNSKNLNIDGSILLFIILIGLILLIGFVLFRVLVGYVIEVGCRKFFVKADTEELNINHVMSGFKKGYGNIVLAMLYRSVLLVLWTLLFVIPGIIKGYAYTFVPYLLAEDPEMKPSRAIELSNKMTNGHKFDMFVLDLSFIGWYILGTLALCIGVLFVNPYRDATQAQLYLKLRGNIIKTGETTYSELNLVESEEASIESDEWRSVFDRDDY